MQKTIQEDSRSFSNKIHHFSIHVTLYGITQPKRKLIFPPTFRNCKARTVHKFFHFWYVTIVIPPLNTNKHLFRRFPFTFRPLTVEICREKREKLCENCLNRPNPAIFHWNEEKPFRLLMFLCFNKNIWRFSRYSSHVAWSTCFIYRKYCTLFQNIFFFRREVGYIHTTLKFIHRISCAITTHDFESMKWTFVK